MQIIKTKISHFYKKNGNVVNILFLVACIVAVFFNSLSAYYSEVDDLNSLLHSDRKISSIFFTNTYGGVQGGNYRPYEVLSHQIDKNLFGADNYFARRLTNVFVHVLNAILIYFLTIRFFNKRVIGLIAGLFFGLHIVNGNSLPPVAWISGRVDPFVTLFILLTLLLFIRFLDKGSILSYIGSFFTFIFALWSKEMAFTFPIVILLYLFFFRKIKTTERLTVRDIKLLPLLTLLGAILLVLFALLFSPNIVANLISPDGILTEETQIKIHSYRLIAVLVGGFSAVIFVLSKLSNTFLRLLASFKLSIPYFVILFLYMIVRVEVIGGIGGNYKSKAGENVIFNLGIDTFMRDTLALVGLVFPVGADFNYEIFHLQLEHTIVFYILSLIPVLLLVWLFIWLIKTKKYSSAFFFLWIFISMIPVHNSLIASGQYQSRYLYLPAVAFCILLANAIYMLAQNNKLSSRFNKIGLALFIIFILLFNSYFIVKNNMRIVESGKIMRTFVNDMKKYSEKITKADNLFFITFPVSEINSMDAVFVHRQLHEPLNYVDTSPEFERKYKYSFLLYDQSQDQNRFKLTWINDTEFFLSENISTCSYLIPEKVSAHGRRMEKIFKEKPHARLENFSSLGEMKETLTADVRVSKLYYETNKKEMIVSLKDSFIRSAEYTLFFLYDRGHFKLVKEANFGKLL